MKERPILFSGAMVRALLAGDKTQTRRAMKPQPANDIARAEFPNPDVLGWVSSRRHAYGHSTAHIPPYGQPGDRLWVRESFRLCAEADATKPRDTDAAYRVWHEADAPHQPGFGKLRPGMFMPRWASRIMLEVTGVRVQRLQDISADDAKAEGISEFIGGWWCEHDDAEQIAGMTPQEGYRSLWERINGAGSWEANPWVWVVEFRRAP